MTNPIDATTHESTASTVGKRSIHTNFLVQAMREIPEGQTFTYAQAEEITQLPKVKLMGYLYSAVNILLKEYGLNFQCDRTVGYTHIPAENVPSIANRRQVKKIRATTSKYRDELEAVDPVTISQQAKIEHTLGLTNVAIMESVATAKAQRELKKTLAAKPPSDPMKSLDIKGIMEAAINLWK